MSSKNEYIYLAKLDLKNPWHFIAVGFGSGLSKKAPGTMGSIAALPLCALLMQVPTFVQIIFILFSFYIGTKACQKAEDAMGIHDHGGIVIDEFVGMFISILFLPKTMLSLFIAFILFRIFDILKPFPIGFVDKRVSGGFGIMIDDVIAGIFALITAHLLYAFF